MRYRTLYFYGDHFKLFFSSLESAMQKKVLWTLRLLQELEIIPSQYFKHLEGTKGLYEIKVVRGRNSYRIFCFFDESDLVVVTTGFRKTSRKTPKRELRKALKIKRDYEKEKHIDQS